MAVLKNSRHEIVAQERFKGKSLQEAMEKAGYSPKWARSAGSRLLSTNVNITERILELGKRAASDAIMSVRERKERLSEIARARLTDYVTCGPDRDLISVGPESPNTAALQEVISRTEYDKNGAGVAVITKIKLHDPVKSIAELNKIEGEYVPSRMELSGKGGLPLQVDIDGKGKLISILNRLAARAREAGSDKQSEPGRS